MSTDTASTGFDRFELHDSLVRGIRAAGFETPRPIQHDTIPHALEGQDVLGLAQTGTGKTAAFALPVLDQLLDARPEGERHRGIRAAVLAPTRELATQIAEEIEMLARFTRLKVVTIFGGVGMNKQIHALRKNPQILVGCPGRILDLVQQRELRLDRVETLVLDEADHMFDMGFLPSVRKILHEMPEDRQNLLFSATMPKEIRRFADEILHEPHVVELANEAPAETIEHALFPVQETSKRDLLLHMLDDEACSTAIVFTRTKHRARRLAMQLDKAGHKAVALQGNMSQSQRDRAMKGFRARQFDVLVATDIAARGIDVSQVSHVINYDVPATPEAYTHRIGRTGRSGHRGQACTFVTSDDRDWLRATERMIGEMIPQRRVEGLTIEGFERPEPRRPGNPGRSPQGARKASGGRRPRAQGGGQRSSGGGQRSSGGGQRSSGGGGGGQRSSGGGQRSSGGGQRSSGGGQRSSAGGQPSSGGGQRSSGGGQRSSGGGQRSAGGGQRSSSGDQRSGGGGQRSRSSGSPSRKRSPRRRQD